MNYFMGKTKFMMKMCRLALTSMAIKVPTDLDTLMNIPKEMLKRTTVGLIKLRLPTFLQEEKLRTFINKSDFRSLLLFTK